MGAGTISVVNAGSKDRYFVSTDPEKLDRDLVHRFLSERSHWARGIPEEVVDRAIDNSLCFGAYLPPYEGAHGGRGEEQVGFARVVTDQATFAYLDDFFVLDEHRGRGLAGRLLEAVLDHPEVRGLKSVWLLAGTPEARRVFERAGFGTPEPDRLQRWMTLPGDSRGFYLGEDAPARGGGR